MKIRVVDAASPSQPGRPVLLDTLPNDLPEGLKLQLLQHENPRKSKQLMLKGETDRIKFEAVNFGPTSTITSAFSYALAYVDEEDPDCLHIVGPCERLSGKRVIKALEHVVDASKEPTAQQLDYFSAQTALGEAFGTKKRKQAIHSLEKNQIDMDRLQSTSAAFINKTIDEAIISRLPTPEPSEAGSFSGSLVDNGVLPPYFICAEKPQECYPLIGKLIPNDIWMGLPQFNQESDFLSSLNPGTFVKSRLTNIQFKPDANEQFIAAYLQYLIKLSALKEPQYNDSSTTSTLLYGMDNTLKQRILEEFAEKVTTDRGKVRFKLPSVKKDKLLLHICILSLHLDPDMCVCINELAEDIRIPLSKMIQYYRASGCAVETSDKRKNDGYNTKLRYARLQTPLVFPKPAFKR